MKKKIILLCLALGQLFLVHPYAIAASPGREKCSVKAVAR